MLHINRMSSIVLVIVSLSLALAAVPAAAQTPTPSLSATLPTTETVPSAAEPVNSALFVGWPYAHLVGDYVRRLAQSGTPPLKPSTAQVPWPETEQDSSLEAQWKHFSANGTKPIEEVSSGGPWDVVVLEQDLGPGWPGSVASFAEYAGKWRDSTKEAGADTVLFMPWATKDGKAPTTEDIATAYTKVGKELGVKVAPVALAWQRAMKERPDLNLYNKTGDDRNATGFYLSVCVLYATLFDRSPEGLPYRMDDLTGVVRRATLSALNTPEDWTLSEADAAFLQKVAWDTVQEYRSQK